MAKIVTATTIKQGVNTAGGVGADFVAMNIIDEMMFIAPFQTPFLNYLFMNKAIKWNQTAHPQGLCEIIERELTPNVDTVVNGGTGGSTTITIIPAEPYLFRVGTAIKFAETDETGIVTTNTAGTSFVATRDLDSTNSAQNWTAPSVGSSILLLGSAHGENDSPPTNVYVNPYLRKTRVQLFQETIKMTDMMVASTMAGGTRGGNYWNQQMKDASAKMKIDIENAMVMNENHFIKAGTGSIGTSGGTVVTKTEGAFYQIANNGGTVLQYGASADKSDIKNFFRSMKYGSKKKTFFVGDDLMNDIEDAIEDRIIFNTPLNIYSPIGGDDVINVFRWRTNNLVVDIIRNPQWTDKYSKYGMLLDDGYVQGFNYAPDKKGSRKFRLEMGIQANGEPREEAQLLAHVGIGIECAPCHGIMKP